MKRNLFLLILLAIVGSVAIILWKQKTRKEGSVGDNFELFTVKDTASVGKLFLADRQGNEALITRSGKYTWLYQNRKTGKTYPANPEVLNLLLKTICDIRTRMRVPLSAEKTVINELSTNQVKVEIYDRSSNKIKAYYMGELAFNETGSNAIMEDSNVPYIVFEQAFVGDLQPRYTALERAWRDLAAFRYDPALVQNVNVNYFQAGQEQFSFEIARKGSDYEAKNINAKTKTYPADLLKKDYAAMYLNNYSSLIAEQRVYNTVERDSLLANSDLFCEIKISQVSGQTDDLKLYPIDTRKLAREDGKVSLREKIARYICIKNDGEDVLILQHDVISKYLVAYPYFFGQALPK